MIDKLAYNQQQFVKKIFEYVSTEEYGKAEVEVGNICKKIIDNVESIHDKSSYLLLIDVLYSEFNDYFAIWMKEQQKDRVLPESSKNIFIEHCNDSSKMEDMLWEAANMLTAENRYSSI